MEGKNTERNNYRCGINVLQPFKNKTDGRVEIRGTTDYRQ